MPLLRGTAGILIIAYPLSFYHVNFGANQFVMLFLRAMPGVFHVRCCFWGRCDSRKKYTRLFQWNSYFLDNKGLVPGKMEYIPEETASSDRVKSRVTQKEIRMDNLKSIIEKGDVADNAKAVRENGEVIIIAEMTIDVLLFCVRIESSFKGMRP